MKEIYKKIINVFENEDFYKRENAKISDLAEILGISLKELEEIFSTEMDYSFEEMLSAFRGEYNQHIF